MPFDWDPADDHDGNTFKISQRIDPDEYEAILLYGDAVKIGEQEEEGEIRYRVVGAETYGALWTLVYTFRGPMIRPIAAFPTTKAKESNKFNSGRPPAPMPQEERP